jgi:hypothetical protein
MRAFNLALPFTKKDNALGKVATVTRQTRALTATIRPVLILATITSTASTPKKRNRCR